MQISNLTLEILKNFSAINPIFTFDGDGTILRTQSPLKDLVAFVEVEEQFPEFHIYDMRSFLSTVGLVGDGANFEFGQTDVRITSQTGKKKAVYAFCSKDLVEPPKKTVNTPVPDLVVDLTKDIISGIINAARTVGVTEITFKPAGPNTVLLCATAAKNEGNPNTFSVEVEAERTPTDDKSYVFKIESFKFIPANYTVSISSVKARGIAEFKTVLGNGKTLRYWTSAAVAA